MNTFTDFSDLDDGLSGAKPIVAALSSAADLQKAAHVANGGELTFPCPKCKGSGVWRGSFVTKPCFTCKGKKTVGRAVVAAAKGRETKAANIIAKKGEFEAEYPGLIAGLRAISEWHSFAGKMVGAFEEYGFLTEGQRTAAVSSLAKVEASRIAKNAERDASKAANSGTIGVEAINALFTKATESGLKKPVFRTEFLTIKLAKGHPGTLYVMDSRVPNYGPYGGAGFAGKIIAGKFEARREAKADTLALLCEIAADPKESAVRYGRSTNNCGCCGRELTDPASVAAGIGPICADNWGF